MSTRMNQAVVRRPNLPLSADDDRDLEFLKQSPQYREALSRLAVSAPDPDATLSEGVLLHAIFEVGMAAVRELAMDLGYQELASDAEYLEAAKQRRKSARRPRWADES